MAMMAGQDKREMEVDTMILNREGGGGVGGSGHNRSGATRGCSLQRPVGRNFQTKELRGDPAGICRARP